MLFPREEKLIKIAFNWQEVIRWINKKIIKTKRKYENKREYNSKVYVERVNEEWIDIVYTTFIDKNGKLKTKESRRRIEANCVPANIQQMLDKECFEITEEIKNEVQLISSKTDLDMEE